MVPNSIELTLVNTKDVDKQGEVIDDRQLMIIAALSIILVITTILVFKKVNR